MNAGSLLIWAVLTGGLAMWIAASAKMAYPEVKPVRIKANRRRQRARDSR